jgi:hypothetical protein
MLNRQHLTDIFAMTAILLLHSHRNERRVLLLLSQRSRKWAKKLMYGRAHWP